MKDERVIGMWKSALGLPVSYGMMMLGQVEQQAQTFPYADLVLQGGALAVLTWAVWHAYKNIIPDLRKEIREDRARYTTSLDNLSIGFQKTLDTMADRHERAEQATADRFERWEAARHADSERLAESLNSMAVTCAETRHAICQTRKV